MLITLTRLHGNGLVSSCIFRRVCIAERGAIVCLLGLRFSLSLNRGYFAAFSRISVPRHAYIFNVSAAGWWNIFETFFFYCRFQVAAK